MKMRLLIPVLFVATLAAQNPNTAVYPTTLATDEDLLVASDRASTTLSSSISAAATSIPVTTATRFTPPMVITIGSEQIKVCSKSGNTLTVCPAGRGFAGTTAASAQAGTAVSGNVVAHHINQLAAELKAVQTFLTTGPIPPAKLGTGTPSAANYLRGDGTWATAGGGGTWGSITGTLSSQTDLQTALDGKLATGGTAAAATALAANGANCSAGQFPLGVDASGAAESCTALPTTISGTASQITASAATGAVTLSLPATINVNTSGNAATATALAANPTDCSAGQYATTIAASGNLTCAQVAYSELSGAPAVAGSGTELQYRGGASTFSALANSSVPNAGELAISTAPSASATRSVFRLGNAIVGGSANGTYIGINNASGTYAGNFLEFQDNGTRLITAGKDTYSRIALRGNNYPTGAYEFYTAAGNHSFLNGHHTAGIYVGHNATTAIDTGYSVRLPREGGIKLETPLGAKPTCDVNARGWVWHAFSGAGVNDTVEYCGKDSSDTYAWRGMNTTITGTANEISASASTGPVTLALPSAVSLAGKALTLPSSTTLPATCSVGQVYMDTDAGSGQRIFACESTNTWVVQGGGGYTLQFFGNTQSAPADATTYYFGNAPAAPIDTNAGWYRVYVPRSGTIRSVYGNLHTGGATGTGENSSLFVRINNTTDVTITTTRTTNNVSNPFSVTGLSQAVVAGDYLEIKWVTPTWATNPTNVRASAVVFIE